MKAVIEKNSCPCAKCNPDCANHCYSNELSNRREGCRIAEQLLALQERFCYTESVFHVVYLIG